MNLSNFRISTAFLLRMLLAIVVICSISSVANASRNNWQHNGSHYDPNNPDCRAWEYYVYPAHFGNDLHVTICAAPPQRAFRSHVTLGSEAQETSTRYWPNTNTFSGPLAGNLATQQALVQAWYDFHTQAKIECSGPGCGRNQRNKW